MRQGFHDKKLIIGFAAFLLLTISIGAIGISQIYFSTRTVQKLGQKYLPRERLILEMKSSNALYAMGIRNYVFWRISKYLQSAAIASDRKFIDESAEKFKLYLLIYAR